MIELDTFRGAVADLGWRFNEADSEIGIRGQDINPDRVGGGWDDARSDRAHLGHLDRRFRRALDRRARVDAALAEMGPLASVAREIFTPFGRISNGVADGLTIRGERVSVCIVGIALRTDAARVGYAKSTSSLVEPDREDYVRWLEEEFFSASRQEGEFRRLKKGIPSNHVFEKIKAASAPSLLGVLGQYRDRRGKIPNAFDVTFGGHAGVDRDDDVEMYNERIARRNAAALNPTAVRPAMRLARSAPAVSLTETLRAQREVIESFESKVEEDRLDAIARRAIGGA